MSHLKLKAPEALPALGLSSTSFQAFKARIIGYILQDTTNYLFVHEHEGNDDVYSEWQALKNGRRIGRLSEDDPDNHELHQIQNAEERTRKQARLLLKRNSQLQRCIQLITDFLHYTEVDDVNQRCTSIDCFGNICNNTIT